MKPAGSGNPRRAAIRADGSDLRLRSGGEPSGEDVIPGFRRPVDVLFPSAQSAAPTA